MIMDRNGRYVAADSTGGCNGFLMWEVVVVKNGRPGLPREARVRFWEGIRAGLGTREAAAAAGVGKSVASWWFGQAGGVKGNAPRAGSGRYLSVAEREEIALARARGESVRGIGARLGRAASTRRRGGGAERGPGDLPGAGGAGAGGGAGGPAEDGEAGRE